MKDILSRKRKLKHGETIVLTEECSAILQNKLPPKPKDPGSFTILYDIGEVHFDKALCDLATSINLMPLSIFKKLGIGEVKAHYGISTTGRYVYQTSMGRVGECASEN